MEDLLNLPIIIKKRIDKNRKGIDQIYLFLHHYSNIKTNDELVFFLVDEKNTSAGSFIQFSKPADLILEQTYCSRGGTHWQKMYFTKNCNSLNGERITATRNNHNHYNISVNF